MADMKKFIIRLIVFFAVMLMLDRAFGLTMDYILTHAKGGLAKHRNYILNQSYEDILIFGSSRALHHYNPQIIQDSLHMSCLNCGVEGMGMPMFYGWWNVIKERYTPKIIIYEVLPKYDYYRGEDNHKYLGILKEQYDKPGIVEVFNRIDKNEYYKMMSYLYRYNSRFLQIIQDFLHPMTSTGDKGFVPIEGEFDPMQTQLAEKNNINNSMEIDSLKASFIQSFVKSVKQYDELRLFFVISPVWYDQPLGNTEWLQKVCKRNNVPLIDYSSDVKYVHNDKYFKDGVHLNSLGADEYTRDLIRRIREYIGY